MTKYAAYNSNASQPVPVASWYDSGIVNHIDFTKPGFLKITEEQWNNRKDKVWCASGNSLVEYVPPPENIDVVRAAQIQILSSACAKQIISGFSSSALGTPNNYASGEIDQQNIVQSAQSTKGGLLSCANASGVWTRQPHTQAQAQQVLEDFVTARDAARLKLAGLEAKVEAATTIEEVQAIVWESDK